MYLVNTTVFMGLYLGLSLYKIRVSSANPIEWLAQTADVIYIVNCVIDALIYELYFKEVRIETIKIISVVFPGVKPYIGKMGGELYVSAYELKEKNGLERCKE